AFGEGTEDFPGLQELELERTPAPGAGVLRRPGLRVNPAGQPGEQHTTSPRIGAESGRGAPWEISWCGRAESRAGRRRLPQTCPNHKRRRRMASTENWANWIKCDRTAADSPKSRQKELCRRGETCRQRVGRGPEA